jgi:hypothetical protein
VVECQLPKLNVVSSNLIGRLCEKVSHRLAFLHKRLARCSNELRVCTANTLRVFDAAGARAAESHRPLCKNPVLLGWFFQWWMRGYSDELRVCVANTLRVFAAAGARAAESHRRLLNAMQVHHVRGSFVLGACTDDTFLPLDP